MSSKDQFVLPTFVVSVYQVCTSKVTNYNEIKNVALSLVQISFFSFKMRPQFRIEYE
jgi:hypothetical protein